MKIPATILLTRGVPKAYITETSTGMLFVEGSPPVLHPFRPTPSLSRTPVVDTKDPPEHVSPRVNNGNLQTRNPKAEEEKEYL